MYDQFDEGDGLNGCRGILYALGVVALIAIAMFLAATANATGSNHDNVDIDVDVSIESDLSADATADAAANSTADSASQSAADSTSSNGDMISTNSSQFYALSLMFPGASDCFTGVQGGVRDVDANQGSSGFLGLHLLNTSCWMDKLASQESDIEINARLKCGDKKYRNAVAYDTPKRERQAACIAMKVASGKDQMQSYKNTMQSLLDKANEDKQTLLDLRDHDRQVCKESVERCQERLNK